MVRKVCFKATSKQLNAKVLELCFLCFWCQKVLYLYQNDSDFKLSTAQGVRGQLDLHEPDAWSRTVDQGYETACWKQVINIIIRQFYKEDLEVLYSSSTTFARRAGRRWRTCYVLHSLQFWGQSCICQEEPLDKKAYGNRWYSST